MRGPGYKLTGDVRRTWRCSQCGFERKLLGDVTALMCRCREGVWMQIVGERTSAPRPIQRPSDVERRPIDFGIEPPPPTPPKPEATIVKSAIDREFDSIANSAENETNSTDPETNVPKSEDDDNWGEGIL